MKKFLILVIIGIAAWQAWKHYPSITERKGSNEARVENRSHRVMVKLRLIVGDQTFVRESLDNGATASFPFRVDHDAPSKMVWEWKDGIEEKSWSGGTAGAAP